MENDQGARYPEKKPQKAPARPATNNYKAQGNPAQVSLQARQNISPHRVLKSQGRRRLAGKGARLIEGGEPNPEEVLPQLPTLSLVYQPPPSPSPSKATCG